MYHLQHGANYKDVDSIQYAYGHMGTRAF